MKTRAKGENKQRTGTTHPSELVAVLMGSFPAIQVVRHEETLAFFFKSHSLKLWHNITVGGQQWS